MNYSGSVRNSKQRLILIGVLVLIICCSIGFLLHEPKEAPAVVTVPASASMTAQPIPKPTAEPKTIMVSLGTFEFTAYGPCEKCCGKYGRNRPIDEDGNLLVYTASGELAKEGVTIAADTDILPFGSKVIVDSHEYIVQDRGGVIKGNKIDVYFENHQDALEFGVQYKEVFIERMVEND
jgi:3D (Asp-Asp-Asp) domain-containing protein